MVKSRAVFIDRDGTLIRDVGYLCELDQIELLSGVPDAIRLLRQHGLRVVMVTNQSAVARGLLSEEGLFYIHEEIQRRLRAAGAFLDGIYYCPHHPTEGNGPYRVSCNCRKPKPGMIDQASSDMHLDPRRSYVVGDQMTDMTLAAQVGARGILIRRSAPGWGEDSSLSRTLGLPTVASVERDCLSAAQWIVRDLRRQPSSVRERRGGSRFSRR